MTLRLYRDGWKVVYTPYLQAPSECVSTLKRLIRQRMRWAEGSSYNIRKMFAGLMWGRWEQSASSHQPLAISNSQLDASSLAANGSKTWVSSKLTLMEKLEFLYLSPYYLQAAFFLIGTFSWFLAEAVFQVRLPFWTALWGWSLVFTNMFALPLMNTVGLFLEESEERDYTGILSFVGLTYLLVPFQAYASLKGFLEKEEGPWFRTPKTGLITDIFTPGRFTRFITGIFGRPAVQPLAASHQPLVGLNSLYPKPYTLHPNSHLSLATANNRFENFRIRPKRIKWLGRTFLAILLLFSTTILSLAPTAPYFIKPQEAQAKGFGTIVGPQNDVNSKSQVTNQKTELIEKRTQNSKTYFLGSTEDGRARYALDSSIGDIHYKDHPDNPAESWQEIDTEVQPVTDKNSGYDYQNITNNFKSFFKKESTADNTVRYEYNGSFITFTLEDNELGKINQVEGFAKDNQFIYPNAFDNIDVKYSIGARVLLEEFVLYQPKDIAKISQRVHFEDAYYQEQEDGSINFYSTKTNELVWSFPKPKMYELNEREDENGLPSRFDNLGLRYEITKDGDDYIVTKVLDQDGKDWLNSSERVYPLVIDTTLDLQVGTSADDGYRRTPGTTFSVGVSNPSLGARSGFVWNTFARWTGVTLAGTIDVSYIQFYAEETGGGSPLLKVYGIDEDNPAAPTTAAGFDADPLTTAAVDWDGVWTINTWAQSPSLNSIFQELVDTYAISNEAVMVQVKNDGAADGNYNAIRQWDYAGNVSGPKLHIEYTPANQVDTSTSANATAYSFQRKTWYDGTRLWSAFYSGSEIEFWYSADWGTSWTQNTSATIAVSTNDFTIEADTADAFITYTNGYDIIANEDTGTYPATNFAWGASPTTVYDGTGATDEYDYPAIARDSNNKVWITATHLSSTNYIFKARQSTTANDISAWQTVTTLDTSTNSNKYGTIVSLGSGNMYATWIDGTAIEGKKYGSISIDAEVGVGADDGYWSPPLSSFNSSATSFAIGSIDYSTQHSFVRFPNISIAQGTTISTAYVTFTANPTQVSTPIYTNLYMNDVDDASAPTTSAGAEALSLTAAFTAWDSIPSWTDGTSYQSPSIVSAVQEVVDRAGWASNQAMMLLWRNDGTSGWKSRSAASFDHTTYASPVLHLEYTGWDSSPTAIATGVTGLTNNMSAVSDSSGNAHLLYIDSNDYTVYQEYTTSWQTAVTLDGNAGNDYATISLNTSNNDLYALWIRSNVIYYKKGVSPYASGNWDTSATSWKSTGTNAYVTSNYSGAGMIFAQWTSGTSSPYSVMWDYIIIPEKLWLLLGLGLVIPAWIKRKKKLGYRV